MNSRRLGAILGGVVALSGLAACSGPRDNAYIENNDAGVFARLPVDWTVFPAEDDNPVANPAIDLDAGVWRVLVDASERPLRSHIEEDAPDAPVGYALVAPLAGTQIQATQMGLRSLATADGSDPMAGGAPGVEVASYDEIDFGHAWGNQITITYEQPSGALLKVTQLAFIDDGSNRLTLFTLGCSADCYEDNADEIGSVIASFTLEDR